jgi:hypothetical protein
VIRLDAETGGVGYFLLRWGHALVWIFLSASFFLKSVQQDGASRWSNLLANLGGVTYVAFLLTFFLNG